MDTKQLRANRTHIVAVGLGIFALLVITVMLEVSCNKPDGTPRQLTATPTPSPTPLGSPTEVPPGGDTPIIVKGGGSIDLDYNETLFTGTPLTCANCTITSLTLDQIPKTGDPPNPSPTPCTFPSPSTEISIETNHGNQDGITIKSTPGVGVQIIPALHSTYGDFITECGDEKKHHSVSGEIQHIRVVGVAGHECDGCNGNKKRCKIEVTVSHP